MASKPTNILMIGATGIIGQHITSALLSARASFGQLGILTSESTIKRKSKDLEALQLAGVRVHVGDLTSEKDVREAYAGYDTVISAVGRPIIDQQVDLVKWAEATDGVKTFYPSEFGTDIEYGPQSKDEKPHQGKLRVRKYIRENVKRLAVTYVVTGPFADGYLGKGKGNDKAGSWDVRAKRAVLLGTGQEKVSLTTMGDVGRLTVASLLSPEAAANKALKVNSFTTTPNGILAEFERQTGAKWEVSYTSLDELKKLEKEVWDAGNPAAALFTLRRIWTEGGTLYEHRDNEVIGPVEVQDLSGAVKDAIAVQTGD